MIPYLIAHKVRGEQAYDIAEQMTCPECAGEGCVECDDLGYWWICSTSGHRAYPYWQMAISALFSYVPGDEFMWGPPATPPVDLLDHYITRQAKAEPKAPSTLLQSLGLLKRTPINRRI